MMTKQHQHEIEPGPGPGLWAQIKEDLAVAGGDWTLPGFRAVAVHRFGVWRMNVRFAPLRKIYSFIYHRLYRYVRNHYGIELYYTSTVGRRFHIGHQGGIVVHHHAVIGDDCTIRQGVTIGAARLAPGREPPKIGHRVSIGAGAVIVGSVTIGDDVTIGPNALVMSNIPGGATVTATPGRVIPAAKRADDTKLEAGAGDGKASGEMTKHATPQATTNKRHATVAGEQ